MLSVRLPAPKQQVEIIEVKDQLTLKDDAGEIRLYGIDNPHVDGMLLGHVVKDNVVWVTDLYSPGPRHRQECRKFLCRRSG